MHKILFVCHGNICRSPMAEMVMKDLVKKAGLENDFYIDSAACRTDEIGNPIHHGTRTKLKQMGVPFTDHRARLISIDDYEDWDLIIAMDTENMRDLNRILGQDTHNKFHKLLEFTGQPRDVADPWYTGNFDATWNDVLAGCKELLKKIVG